MHDWHVAWFAKSPWWEVHLFLWIPNTFSGRQNSPDHTIQFPISFCCVSSCWSFCFHTRICLIQSLITAQAPALFHRWAATVARSLSGSYWSLRGLSWPPHSSSWSPHGSYWSMLAHTGLCMAHPSLCMAGPNLYIAHPRPRIRFIDKTWLIDRKNERMTHFQCSVGVTTPHSFDTWLIRSI